jgi:hypothetical protein
MSLHSIPHAYMSCHHEATFMSIVMFRYKDLLVKASTCFFKVIYYSNFDVLLTLNLKVQTGFCLTAELIRTKVISQIRHQQVLHSVLLTYNKLGP